VGCGVSFSGFEWDVELASVGLSGVFFSYVCMYIIEMSGHKVAGQFGGTQTETRSTAAGDNPN